MSLRPKPLTFIGVHTLLAILGCMFMVMLLLSLPASADRPNVLLIMVDDLRPALGCYGDEIAVTPNMDALAAEGAVFRRNYCNVPVCGASRASMFTGLRPNRTRFRLWNARIDTDAPEAVTIASHFSANGHQTNSLGKTLHSPDDRPKDWTEQPWRPDYSTPDTQVTWRDYQTEANLKIADSHNDGAGPSHEAADVPDNGYRDGVIAEVAIEKLKTLSKSEKPFLLTVGFIKPHLPFNAPKKYWDRFSSEQFALPSNYVHPKDAPLASLHNFSELRDYTDIPDEGPVPDELAIKLMHGYYACTHYIDVQIGRVLDELKRQNLDDNTIIVLCGDHGWTLGEHRLWCKHANYKTALQTPMIVRIPGQQKGVRVDELTELIDVFPTLCEATGIEIPQQIEGNSVIPLIENLATTDWKKSVFSRFYAGETVTTDDFAFTRYVNKDNNTYATMLYDHRVDPDENENVVAEMTYQDAIEDLGARLDSVEPASQQQPEKVATP